MTQVAINEIFYSVQGESTQAGRPCTFVRLMGCPLRCTYCDTEYAFYEGQKKSIDEIIDIVKQYPTKLVEVTGGEPLAQKNSIELMHRLVEEGFEVMLETSGAFDVSAVPRDVRIIMDIKTPTSGEAGRQHWENFANLKPGVDEIKCVVGSREDFDYALKVAKEKDLFNKHVVLISPVFGKITNIELANLVLESAEPWRMQLQMHKYIWEPSTRGV
ncbi:MAG TPA: radical SAM protein [Bdellovibrionota bacterium]|jgi:7-carboxy-7-deazaguanine synthase|nr:radical SAM protein [Bdellovibrionota bacterium]